MKKILISFLLLLSGCSTFGITEITGEDVFEVEGEVIAPHGYIEMKQREQEYYDLAVISLAVHRRFSYMTDKEQFGLAEYWQSMREIRSGTFKGDCEDFVQAVKKELLKEGKDSHLAVCAIDGSKFNNHVVLIYKNWIVDNRYRYPNRRSELDYNCTKILINDQWLKIKGVQ